MPVGDYPSLPEMPKVVGTIDRDSLVEATSTTEHAVARGGNLPILAALNLRGSAKELTIAATDRFRVARVTSPLSKGKKFEANVPASAIIGAIKGLAGTVALGCDGGLFGVSDGRRSITTRIVGDGDPFPAIDVLFEKVPPDSIEVDGALLAEAVKRSLLVTEEHDLILVEVSGEAQMIHVSTDSELGEGVEEVECEGGTSIALRFNGSYLLQALNAATAGRVRISTSTPTAAVRIEPVGDESVAFIVMPRRSKK